MPMPKPQADESKADFIDRCMSDGVMIAEFEQADERLAVCNRIWGEDEIVDRRWTIGDTSELRMLASDGKEPTRILGYASVFNSLSEPLPFGREIIVKGAFANSLRTKADVVANYNHGADGILGRTGSGTLKLKEDNHGLFSDINPPNTSTGRDVVELMRRGDLSGMSFQFRTIADEWSTRDGEPLRMVTEADLLDVSVVTWPAYEAAKAELRSYRGAFNSLDHWRADHPVPLSVLRARLDLLLAEG